MQGKSHINKYRHHSTATTLSINKKKYEQHALIMIMTISHFVDQGCPILPEAALWPGPFISDLSNP